MTFEELLDTACTVACLPSMARKDLPSVLSDKTQKLLLKLPPDKVGSVLSYAIDAINHGSIESIDTLVRKGLECEKE